ncbi:hypothetical protein NE865_08566 [Phthorimaea operculella]|nr:hypothetical protein NE865_08566 [Phthorimaea operculella]
MLVHIREEKHIISWITEFIYAGYIVSNIACTGATGQMVMFQVNALKIQLHGMLLTENDKNKISDINRMLGYIEAQELLRPVAGVIPLDLRLVTTAFSVFATYMVMVVQLTHIFD